MPAPTPGAGGTVNVLVSLVYPSLCLVFTWGSACEPLSKVLLFISTQVLLLLHHTQKV